VDVSFGGTLEFWLRGGNEGLDGPLWNNSENGESVILDYSKDGVNWFQIQIPGTTFPSLSTWQKITVTIPAGAYSRTTQFRWRQLANSGPGLDCWALEDLLLQAPAPASPGPVPFVISSPSSCTSIAVLWVSAPGATSYAVERKQGSQPWTRIAAGRETYYTDDSLAPQTAYSYRIQALNAGGSAPYSSVTTSATWSQLEQWSYDNFGSKDAISPAAMTLPDSDGTLPLLRYAFNLTLNEPEHYLQSGGTSGFPAIWLDQGRDRLCVEFVRRKASMNPGIIYHVQFSSNLADWASSGVEVNRTSIDAVWERVRYEDTLTQGQVNPRFCKIAVTAP
jgi:hypothetical protein